MLEFITLTTLLIVFCVYFIDYNVFVLVLLRADVDINCDGFFFATYNECINYLYFPMSKSLVTEFFLKKLGEITLQGAPL